MILENVHTLDSWGRGVGGRVFSASRPLCNGDTPIGAKDLVLSASSACEALAASRKKTAPPDFDLFGDAPIPCQAAADERGTEPEIQAPMFTISLVESSRARTL